MATQAQVNSLVTRAARRMISAYWDVRPEIARGMIRTIVSEAKALGGATARKSRNAFLRQVYTDIHGHDPVGKREFVHWVRSALSPAPAPQPLTPVAEPIDDVSLDDGFEATPEDISP